MLVVRKEQVDVFSEHALAGFVEEMADHCKVFSPRLCEVLGDKQLRVVVRRSIDTAKGFGITYRGPVRLYIEMVFLFGSGFALDPQYPWVEEILIGEKYQTQRQKAGQLYRRVLDYQDKVAGPEDRYTRGALERIREMTKYPFPVSRENYLPDMLRLIKRIYPEKASYVGDNGLERIVRKAVDEAAAGGMPSVHNSVLFSTLMFAFGHRCMADPLYPWIENTLMDEKIADGVARAKRLEKKAITWLNSVISSFD